MMPVLDYREWRTAQRSPVRPPALSRNVEALEVREEPGRYEVVIAARGAAGHTSTSRPLQFTILAGTDSGRRR